MSGWREVTLGDVCERVTVGHVGKMSDQYVDDGVPFLRSQNVKPFVIETSGMLRVDETFHRKLSKSALATGDVVVVRTGYPGTAAVVPPELDGSNCADLVVITPGAELNPHLLAAVFNSSWGRSTVGGHLVGAAQQHFNIGSAKVMRLNLPARRVQDQIAEVLCAFHDLIENNRRRVAVLEELARAVYREWFVHFRYPGHGDVPLVDSPLGRIPEGWTVAELQSVAEVNRRTRTPTTDEVIQYLDISTLGERTIGSLNEVVGSAAPGRARRVVEPGDVAWSMVRPNRRAHALLVDPGAEWIASTGLAVLSPKGRSSTWLFETTSRREFSDYLVSQEGGAAYPAVKPKDFQRAPVIVPPSTVDQLFADRVAPTHRLCWSLRGQSDALSSLRDLLLPKLVTGQIDVSHLDLDVLTEAASA